MRVYDVKCEVCAKVSELFSKEPLAPATEVLRPCSCSPYATKQKVLLSTPNISLEGTTGAFPTASDKWVHRLESHQRMQRKYNDGKPGYGEFINKSSYREVINVSE
jgi:hypothetical protein